MIPDTTFYCENCKDMYNINTYHINGVFKKETPKPCY